MNRAKVKYSTKTITFCKFFPLIETKFSRCTQTATIRQIQTQTPHSTNNNSTMHCSCTLAFGYQRRTGTEAPER